LKIWLIPSASGMKMITRHKRLQPYEGGARQLSATDTMSFSVVGTSYHGREAEPNRRKQLLGISIAENDLKSIS
jgi:hypothetical protein